MTKRTVYLSAERRQVYQSLRCLLGQPDSENLGYSMGNSGGSRKSVFLRLGPAHSQELQIKKTAHSRDDDSKASSHRDVFERLSELTTSQVKASKLKAVTSGSLASTHRYVGIQNKRIAQLVIPESCVQETPDAVQDLRQTLNRLRKAKEERKSLDRHVSPMVKFAQRENTTIEGVPRVSPRRPLMANSTENKMKEPATGMVQKSFSKPDVVSPKKLARTDRKGDGPVNINRVRQSAGVHLSSSGPHWQAKAALHHEEFRRAQKWNFLEKRRGIGHHDNTGGGDVIRIIPHEPVISRETFSRKRQAPSIDHLVSPSKRPKTG